MKMFLALVGVGLAVVSGTNFLEIESSSNKFKYAGKTVFLSGVNQPWVDYGNDFGNDQPNAIFCQLNDTITDVTKYKGNSIRTWLHTEGTQTPQFDSNGYVIGTDADNSLIDDMRLYVRAAAKQNVFVFFCLWNGAIEIKDNLKGLLSDTAKLQSYIDKALTPMVKALSNEPGLGGWEIINEPEGSVAIGSNGEQCFDTQKLSGTGAGWTGSQIPMEQFQRFTNLQTAAIHAADPKALVTVGTWSEHSGTDNFGYYNYWKDDCLVKAGQQNNGKLDFYQMHTYPWNGQWSSTSPLSGNEWYSSFGLDKPLVIGEFASNGSPSSASACYNRAFDNGFMGVWDWCAVCSDGGVDSLNTCNGGMNALANHGQVYVSIDSNFDLSSRCSCSDVPPDNQYTCAQQASWGQCSQSWMQGYCCLSCFSCQGCS